jgi:hypothetical protein
MPVNAKVHLPLDKTYDGYLFKASNLHLAAAARRRMQSHAAG